MLKKILKKIIPSKIQEIRISLSELQDQKKITYTGVFKSFNECNKCFLALNNTYYNDEYKNYKNELIQNYTRAVNNNPPTINFENNRFNIFSSFLAGLNISSISILDIGGGSAKQFCHLKYSNPSIKLNYTILELPEVVEELRNVEINELSFIDSFEKIQNKSFDIILFGSSLQYFENYMETIEKCAEFNSKFIVILDTTFSYAPTFVCAQVNMPNRAIPRWVINFNEIENLMINHSYKKINHTFNYYQFHNFDNYNSDERNSYHCTTIYQKN